MGTQLKRLNIAISPCFDNISMASSSLTKNVRGCCNAVVHINGNFYRKVNLKVLKNFQVNITIKRLRSEGIIKLSISPWRAQIVVVRDTENNKRRMCIDYLQTVNLSIELDAYTLSKIEFFVNELAKYCVFSTFDLRSAHHQILIADEN